MAADWTHIHRGQTEQTDVKYIMTGWYTFGGEEKSMFRIRSDNMFALPLYVVRTNNWKEKKKQINNIIDYKKIEKKGLHTFGTDRQNDGKSYIKDFVRIFKEEIDDWLDEINQEECLITDIWTVRYKKGEFQSVHNHGTFGYSGIMYLDYVPRLHETTNFVSPFMTHSTGI